MIAKEELENMSSVEYRNLSCEDRIAHEKERVFEGLKEICSSGSSTGEKLKILKKEGYDLGDIIQHNAYDDEGRRCQTLIDTDALEDLFWEYQTEAKDNYWLCVDQYLLVRLEISWGGPQDYIELMVDKETKEVMDGTYHFKDWFDGAQWSLSVAELEMIENEFRYLWDY